MKVTTRRFTTHSIEHDSKDLPLRFEPANTPEVKVLDNGNIRVGYLAQDEECRDWEDMGTSGKFHSFSHRHRNFVRDKATVNKLLRSACNVPLSYFEHGRCSWTVMGVKPPGTEGDWRWDGVDFAGVWEADEDSKKEWRRLNKAEKIKAAYERAKQECETYTSWCNGEVYGVCVEEFDKDGEPVSDDACWNNVGYEWAGQVLQEEMK